MYLYRTSHGAVDLAFTDRHGGVSRAPYDSLNLALTGEDEAADRAENLRMLLADFAPGTALADLHQVHGAEVVTVDRPPTGERPRADALVTSACDVALLVRGADCVPVLLADAGAGVVGAAHAGRQGVVVGVVSAVVAAMRARGAGQLTAWLGPRICGACYEVPADLQAEVAGREPATRATTSWGTPGLDLGAGVRAQLEREGVEVHDVGRCTRESPDLYSYRRDGAHAGRLGGLIRLRSEPAA